MRQLSYLPSIGPGVRRLLNETAQLVSLAATFYCLTSDVIKWKVALHL